MRVWDIHPGYLDRVRLIGEHRELHAVASTWSRASEPAGGRKHARRRARHVGLSGQLHSDAIRWQGLGWALSKRHKLIAAEMHLRGYRESSPLQLRRAPDCWPEAFARPPGEQFALLAERQGGRAHGRIPLPRSAQEMWAQHKYSVMARSQEAYRAMGQRVSSLRGDAGFDKLAEDLVLWLRKPPSTGNLANALQHMWGYLDPPPKPFDSLSSATLLKHIQRGVAEQDTSYLAVQTALSDLAAWM